MTKITLRGVAAAALVSAAMIGAAPVLAQSMGASHTMHAQAAVTVGGAAMYPTKTIVENAVNSPIHTTLVAAVKAAGLVETLSGPGPFTVFAPTDDAFAKLPEGTVATLVEPANKATLTRILNYHVVSGRITAADLAARIAAGGGKAELTTVEGGTLTASMQGSGIILTDAKGGVSHITQADVLQSNGVIHVTDAVSMPG
ncbi:fasciclin domain-containing protein [soil metagenome]